jgi:hypothetical protein
MPALLDSLLSRLALYPSSSACNSLGLSHSLVRLREAGAYACSITHAGHEHLALPSRSPHRSHRPCVLVVCGRIAMEGRHSSIFLRVNSVNPLARTHDTRFQLHGSKLPSGRSCGDHNDLHPATSLPRVGTAECMRPTQHSPICIWAAAAAARPPHNSGLDVTQEGRGCRHPARCRYGPRLSASGLNSLMSSCYLLSCAVCDVFRPRYHATTSALHLGVVRPGRAILLVRRELDV